MSKKFFPILLFIVWCGFGCSKFYAFNMFFDGSVWESAYEGIGGYGESHDGILREYVDGVEMINGVKCLRIMERTDDREPRFMTYIRISDGKV